MHYQHVPNYKKRTDHMHHQLA